MAIEKKWPTISNQVDSVSLILAVCKNRFLCQHSDYLGKAPIFSWQLACSVMVLSSFAFKGVILIPTPYSKFAFYNTLFWVISSVQFSHSVMSNSLRPHELQHARPPCPSPTPGVYPNSCPLSRWCHPTISSSVVPFSSCLQSFPASGSFPISWLIPSGGQWRVRRCSIYYLWTKWLILKGFPGCSVVKNFTCQCRRCRRRDFLGSGISPGEGNGRQFHYSCSENPKDRGAWWAIVQGLAKSQMWLGDWAQWIISHVP